MSFPSYLLLLSIHLLPATGIDSLTGLVDAINNKYNTFSLVEIIMDELESYMGQGYEELKNLMKTKLTTVKKLDLKPTVIKKGATNATTKKGTLHAKTGHLGNITANKFNASRTITHHSSNKTKDIHEHSQNNTPNAHHSICSTINEQNNTKAHTKNGHSAKKPDTKVISKYGSNNNLTTLQLPTKVSQTIATKSSSFIDRFLHNRIITYYQNLNRKYRNTSYYAAVRQIVDRYFKQFREEIKRLEHNVTTDIKDMKADLIKLYYETTSTTESVDSLLVHYIENKTDDLESYVKRVVPVLNLRNETNKMETYLKGMMHLNKADTGNQVTDKCTKNDGLTKNNINITNMRSNIRNFRENREIPLGRLNNNNNLTFKSILNSVNVLVPNFGRINNINLTHRNIVSSVNGLNTNFLNPFVHFPARNRLHAPLLRTRL